MPVSAPSATVSGGSSGVLWGAAALAAAASATAYGLSRRRAREEQIREMRQRAAEMSSPEARRARLTSLWNAAQARVAPIRAAMASAAAAAAAAKAAQEIQERRKVAYRLAQYQDSLARLGPPTTPFEQTVAWQTPDPELNAAYRLGRIYSSPQLRGEGQLLSGTGTPTPEPVPVGTPPPSGTPDEPTPARVPIAPYPQGYLPADPDIFSLEGKWIARSGSLLRSAGRAYIASAVQYQVVEGGRLVVSAPSRAPGTRAGFLSRYFLRGGQYTRSTLSQVGLRQFSLRNLASGARGTIGVGLVTSLISNLWDYTVGTQRETGVLSREFAVSTGVDLVLGVGTGLAAAGLVALAVAAGIVSLTVSGAIAIAAILGLSIGLALDATGVGTALKRGVNEGLNAWPGIIQNGRIIAEVVGQRAADLTSKVARSVADTAESVADTVTTAAREVNQAVTSTAHRVGEAARSVVESGTATVQHAASQVSQGAQRLVSDIASTASDAVENARQFLGDLFGGGD